MTADNVNPYDPPAEMTEPLWSLPPDTEFLFNDDYVASIGSLELPRVCVVSGERTGLISMDSTLTAIPKAYQTALRFVIGAVCTFFVVAFAMEFGPAAEWFLIVPLTVALIAPFIIVAGIRNRHRLKLRWYLSETVARQFATERRNWRIVYAAVGLFLILIAAGMSSRFDTSIGVLIIFAVIAYKMLSRPAVLFSHGEFRGLVLVKGFRSPFIKALRQMMKRYEAQSLH